MMDMGDVRGCTVLMGGHVLSVSRSAGTGLNLHRPKRFRFEDSPPLLLDQDRFR